MTAADFPLHQLSDETNRNSLIKTKTADDSEAQERLNALNILAKQGFRGGDAPLIQALNDLDERVRARAQELMLEDWPVEIASGDHASK